MAEREGHEQAGDSSEPALAREPAAETEQGAASGATVAAARVARLEARVEELTATLVQMDGRLRQLEGEAVVGAPLVSEAPDESAASERPASVRAARAPVSERLVAVPLAEAAPEPAEDEADEEADEEHDEGPSLVDLLPQAAALGGRLLLMLGGGYLLRALTERGTLTPLGGAIAALAYAAVWLGVAHYQARRGPDISATVSGAAFALIAFPLLVEVTARFQLLSAAQAALLIGAATGAGLLVAWHRRMRLLGWIVLGLSIFAAGAALLQTKEALPFLLLSVVMGVAFDWAAAHRRWLPLQIFAAGSADVSMVVFTVLVLVQQKYSLISTFAQLSLFVAYMGSYMLRARLEQRPLSMFEHVQASVVLAVGYLAAMLVARASPGAPVALLGIVSLLAGGAAYAVAYFLFVVPAKNRIEAWFNTSYALVGLLVGSWLLLEEPGFAWAGLGAALAILGIRDEHAALPLHGAVCALFAALGSGLIKQVSYAFWGGVDEVWPSLGAPAFAAIVIAAIALAAPFRSATARSRWPAHAARTLALAVVVAGAGGVLLAVLVGPIGGGLGEGADAGRIAALRTAVIALSALALAGLSRTERLREAGLLVYPALGVGALKLLLQDFPAGRALTLFAGFVLFGLALLVAPRLRRRLVD